MLYLIYKYEQSRNTENKGKETLNKTRHDATNFRGKLYAIFVKL